MKRLKLLSLLGCIILLSSCTPIEFFTVASEVVHMYPPENPLEERLEEFIEEKFDLDENSIDLTPLSPEIKA